jgi:hypothetical protein
MQTAHVYRLAGLACVASTEKQPSQIAGWRSLCRISHGRYWPLVLMVVMVMVVMMTRVQDAANDALHMMVVMVVILC